jgi:uncharacterized peroxidase-related enzyme
MSWIQRTPPDAAPPELKKVYDRIRAHATSQRVSHIWQAWGGNPAGMEASFNLLRVLMDDPAPLTVAQAEMIAVVVSATNDCSYCVAHHGPRLARLAGELIAHDVARDYRSANLQARDRVLLDAAVALTCEPGERKQEDIERLREYGFDDVAILKAVELTAYYNGVTRLVLGLGVVLEPGVEPWEFGSQR